MTGAMTHPTDPAGRISPIARAVAPPFHRLLDRIDRGLEAGTIAASLPNGSRRTLGGRGKGPVAIVDIHRWRALIRLAMSGSVGWYEAWEAGDWSSPDPVPLFDLFMRNRVPLGRVGRPKGAAKWLLRRWHQMRRNTRAGARRNIAYHYDLGNDFYAAWLDPTMSYSSAMLKPGDTLEAGQRRKVAALLDRLELGMGCRMLEIGCGWGFLAEQAASRGAEVVGLTLSTEQAAAAGARAAGAGLTERVTIALTDYRDVTDRFNAVASVEMVEAIGQAQWPTYCRTIARVLKPGGRAAIQFITIADDVFEVYAGATDFIQRYIFPGGMLISESRFRAAAEDAGLAWRDLRHFGASYADTLEMWRDRFDSADREGRLPARLDARFRRLWRYYLMYCEGGFRGGGINVAQVTLVNG